MNASREEDKDNEISVISSVQAKKLYSQHFGAKKQSQKAQWHSDITFEPVPSDYALLRLTKLPKTGGGTAKTPCPSHDLERHYYYRVKY
jgi:alpha-ketoglutarate-dependent taurine dioxygenase